ncbi:hypothetical protein [Caballeronia sp.]|uniref:hypothetical protein n=1 Tax=Caballeronia sp. TaxID=1931223 RepID=UPI003C5AA0F4
MDAADNRHYWKKSLSEKTAKPNFFHDENRKPPLRAIPTAFSVRHFASFFSYSVARIVTVRISTHKITTSGNRDQGEKRNG